MRHPSRPSNSHRAVLLGILIACAAFPANATETTLNPTTDGYVTHGTSNPTDCSVAEIVNTTGATTKVASDQAYTDLRGRSWSVITFGPLPSGTITSATLSFYVKTSLGLDVDQAKVAISYQVIGSGPGSVAAADQPNCTTWNSGVTVDIDEPSTYNVTIPTAWLPAGGWIRFLLSDATVFESSGVGQQTTTICGMEGGDVDKRWRLNLVH